MGLRFDALFTGIQVQKAIEERFERILQAAIMRFKRVGERFVRNARLNGTYNDITGNLRSSIGYVVLYNGVIVESNFKSSKKGAKGTAEAQATVAEIMADFPTGIVLIVVAGMGYAAAVESRGKDVITGSSLVAKTDLQKELQALQSKLKL